MDYSELANTFLLEMHKSRRMGGHKNITSTMQGETHALQYIYHLNCSVMPGEISNGLGVSSARVATTLNSLEKKGYVRREINKDDRRKILVSLTPQGEAAAKAHHKFVHDEVTKMLMALGEHDATEFVRIIRRLSEMFPQKSPPPPM
ncbi:MarR family winged helix-turn-helix transcriptional regulator [Eubacteriales bacterium OttesenSCG-928-K08]|nr:MarR family winged helix-turn-helix transcriptional regulator [Eubacteriales bacterium OttesenSCG-928-K08]